MDIDFYTKIDQELAKIPYCSSKCAYYMGCPVCDRSGTDLAACTLRMLPEAKRRRFVNLYLRGREGMRAEATELLFNLANNLDLVKSTTDITTYIDTIIKIDRAFKAPTSELKRAYEIQDVEVIPDKVEVTVNQKAKKSDPDEKIVRKSIKDLEENVDSLFNSGLIDELKASMKIGEFKLPHEKLPIEIKIDAFKATEPPVDDSIDPIMVASPSNDE
jgi:hypothetical protein